MAVFLSDDWFAQIQSLTEQAGELNLPPSLADVVMNVQVEDAAQSTQLQFARGSLARGHHDDATTTVVLDKATLLSLLQNFDLNQAMEAFMAGKIRVQGDMSQLMALQTAKPSDEQRQLFKNIKAITELS